MNQYNIFGAGIKDENLGEPRVLKLGKTAERVHTFFVFLKGVL